MNQQPILVWDLPTRVAHWLLVICFVGAISTEESERWRLFHVTFGYTMFGLVLFRIIWGFIGSRYSRFIEFVRSPQEVLDYSLNTISGKGKRYIGHNPLGSVAILVMLALILLITVTGYVIFNDLSGEWVEELHEFFGNFLLTVVAIHIGGVFLSSFKHRENLVKAMISGKKEGQANEGIRHSYWWLAILIVMCVGYFWYLQFTK